MRILGIIILSLIALFAGGCSILFLFDTYIGPNILTAIGFGVTGLCIWGIYALTRRRLPAPDETGDDGGTDDAP